ncbi:MAG: ABC transporter permease [Thermodesulfobacteriota bacterium]
MGRLKPGWGLVPIAIFLILWEVTARFHLAQGHTLLPPFSVAIKEFWLMTRTGILPDNFLASLIRVLAGFSAGSVTGVVLGIIMGWNRFMDRALNPIFSLLYPIPALGWLPLFMLWIGINEMLPIAIIFVCSFFPVLYNTITGVKTVDTSYVQAARTLGASDFQILTTVVWPLALPNIFTGLRLEAGMAWRTIIAAEMVAIPTGLGALLMRAESLIRVDIIIVVLIVLAVISLLFERFFAYLEWRLTRKWR